MLHCRQTEEYVMPNEYITVKSWQNALMRMDFEKPDSSLTTVSNPQGEQALMVKSGSLMSYFFYGFSAAEVRAFYAHDECRRRQRYPFRVDLIRVQGGNLQQWNQLNLRPAEGEYCGDRLTVHREAKPMLKGKFVASIPLCIQPYHLVHTKVTQHVVDSRR
jgi:hypothetical protein